MGKRAGQGNGRCDGGVILYSPIRSVLGNGGVGWRAANQSKAFVLFFSYTIHGSGVLDISSCDFNFHL